MDINLYSAEAMERIANNLNVNFEAANGVNKSLYTPIDEIIEKYFKFTIEFIPLKKHIDGYISIAEKKIMVNERLGEPKYDTRCSFTLAHEVGHLILHSQYIDLMRDAVSRFYSDTRIRTAMERQADYIASAILMPRTKMSTYWNQNFRTANSVPDYVKELIFMYQKLTKHGEDCLYKYFRLHANNFRVSPQAFVIRAKQLSLLQLLCRGVKSAKILIHQRKSDCVIDCKEDYYVSY